jgi:hypothetical protein
MKFEKITLFMLSVLLGVAGVLALSIIPGFWKDNPSDAFARVSDQEKFSTKSTGSLEDGDVEIELTPSIDGSRLTVKVGMDTHSVNLGDFDLAEITTLEYGGKTIKPVKAKKPRGHHSYGNIVFDVGEELSSFKIRIKGIPRMQERVYEWDIN